MLAELADTGAGLPDVERPAVLLGQYLSALGILSAEEEENLHVRMLTGAAGLGHTRVVFKAHPTAPARFTRVLEQEAEKLGVDLTVVETPVLAEVLFQRTRPALVVGCFSTALLTASALYGLPVARVGTETLLDRLTPYENSNRVPATIVDALLPDLADAAAVAEGRQGADTGALAALVRTVGFAMQPKVLPELRPEARSTCASTWTRAPGGISRSAGSPPWGCRAAFRRGSGSCRTTPRRGRWYAGRGPSGARWGGEAGRWAPAARRRRVFTHRPPESHPRPVVLGHIRPPIGERWNA